MSNTDRIAACNICLLASAMKDCKNCAFNPSKMKLSQDEQKAVKHTELLKKV